MQIVYYIIRTHVAATRNALFRHNLYHADTHHHNQDLFLTASLLTHSLTHFQKPLLYLTLFVLSPTKQSSYCHFCPNILTYLPVLHKYYLINNN